MTLHNYKSQFELSDVKIKANCINGGSINLKSTDTYYTLIVSNCVLHVPKKDDNHSTTKDYHFKKKNYSIFVPSRKKECMLYVFYFFFFIFKVLI
jgi:hypothetical protein